MRFQSNILCSGEKLSLQFEIVTLILALIQIWNFVKIKRSHYTSYACVEHYTSVYNMPKKPNNPVYWGFVCVITIICGNYLLSILYQFAVNIPRNNCRYIILNQIYYICRSVYVCVCTCNIVMMKGVMDMVVTCCLCSRACAD